jgi:hypothetical protein
VNNLSLKQITLGIITFVFGMFILNVIIPEVAEMIFWSVLLLLSLCFSTIFIAAFCPLTWIYFAIKWNKAS